MSENKTTDMQVVGNQGVEANKPDVGVMLQAIIAKGVTAENVAALDSIVNLYERVQSRESEKEFNRAFSELQSELLPVQAVRPVPDKNGNIKYKYADYRDIMEQVQPLLNKHGFSVRFSSKADDKRMTMICTLMHTGGHSVQNEFTVRIGSGPYGATEAQADSAAGTSAQRNALCDALNIVIRRGDDVKEEGSAVTKAQADELEQRVKLTNSNEVAFLKFAGASSYADIRADKYDMLDSFLAKKERAGR